MLLMPPLFFYLSKFVSSLTVTWPTSMLFNFQVMKQRPCSITGDHVINEVSLSAKLTMTSFGVCSSSSFCVSSVQVVSIQLFDNFIWHNNTQNCKGIIKNNYCCHLYNFNTICCSSLWLVLIMMLIFWRVPLPGLYLLGGIDEHCSPPGGKLIMNIKNTR